MIECQNIHKTYGDKLVNKNISFKLKENKVTGFLGPNGAGKSTLIKIIAGVLHQDKGNILFDGRVVNPGRAHPELGVIFQGGQNAYGYMTVIDNLRYYAMLNNIPDSMSRDRIETLLEFMEIKKEKNKYYYNLSGGMKQKVLIIMALIRDPEVIILDEPTIGLDIVSCLSLKLKIKSMVSSSYNKTLLIASHDFGFINDVCDEVLIIDKGEIKFSGNIHHFKHNKAQAFKIISKVDKSKAIIAALKKENYPYRQNNGVVEFEAPNLSILDKINHDLIIEIKRNDNITDSFLRILDDDHNKKHHTC